MIDSKLKFYIRKSLKAPSLDFEWTTKNNNDFFDFIKETYRSDYLTKDENLLEIKQAFSDYFESVGYILFKIKDFKIKVKVFAYKIKPEDSTCVNDIIDIIDEYEEFIVDNYNSKDDQVLLKKELKDKIFDYVKTIEHEKVNKKKLVKFAVREAFELRNSDIVMLKQDSIFIKLFEERNKGEVTNTQENTKADRYNRISENDMKIFYNEHFSSEDNSAFFSLVAQLFVDKYLLDKHINNQEYEKNVFAYIQLIIKEQLILSFDNCEDFFKGFSGYVLRIHFTEVFENIAEFILYEISISNEYIIDFLKYYSLNIVVFEGIRYRVPALEADSGLRWNVVSMLSIVKLYVKTNTASKLMKHAIDKKREELVSYYVDDISPIEYNNKNTQEKNDLAYELDNLEKTLEKYYDSLKFIKNEDEKDKLQKEIALIKEDMRDIKQERNEITGKLVNRSKINMYQMLEKELESMTRLLRKEDKVLNQNSEGFLSIKKALVKALISKKQKI